jgi:hypothetical protein
MAQTATMTKLRGRHYAAKARAAEIVSANETAVSKATASNENLARRLKSTRFQNTRFNSPSRYESPSKRRDNYATTTQENTDTTNNMLYRTSTRFQNTRYQSPSKRDNSTFNISSPRTSVATTRQRDHQQGNNNDNDNTKTNHVSDREMELVKGISDRLDTGLNEQALGAILDLLKRGEHPDAIVAVVTSLAQNAR